MNNKEAMTLLKPERENKCDILWCDSFKRRTDVECQKDFS